MAALSNDPAFNERQRRALLATRYRLRAVELERYAQQRRFENDTSDAIDAELAANEYRLDADMLDNWGSNASV